MSPVRITFQFFRKQFGSWSLTIPIDCIIAYIVVGPTKLSPSDLSFLDNSVDSGEVALV